MYLLAEILLLLFCVGSLFVSLVSLVLPPSSCPMQVKG